MNPIMTAALGSLALLAASAAYAQQRNSPAAGASYVFGAGPASGGSPVDAPGSSPLFTIGGVGVHVWAPVEPHYNGEANRDPAAESLWGPE
jgi:hypothetical protein